MSLSYDQVQIGLKELLSIVSTNFYMKDNLKKKMELIDKIIFKYRLKKMMLKNQLPEGETK